MRQRTMKSAWSILPLFGWITLAIGLIFLTLGLVFVYKDLWFSEHGVQTTATITDIVNTRKSGTKGGTYRTEVEYEVQGQLRTSVLNQYSSSYRIGKKLDISYDPDRPWEIHSPSIFPFVFSVLGTLFAAGGIIMLAIHFIRKGKKRRLLHEGVCETATIVRTAPNTSVTINGRHPYHVFCEWTDAYGALHTFRSDGLRDDPAQHFQERGIATLPVYMQPGDPSVYHIDMRGLSGE